MMSAVDVSPVEATPAGVEADAEAPLILDFAEEIEILYDEQGNQLSFAQTSRGTHDEPDTQGLDP